MHRARGGPAGGERMCYMYMYMHRRSNSLTNGRPLRRGTYWTRCEWRTSFSTTRPASCEQGAASVDSSGAETRRRRGALWRRTMLWTLTVQAHNSGDAATSQWLMPRAQNTRSTRILYSYSLQRGSSAPTQNPHQLVQAINTELLYKAAKVN